MWLHSNTSIEYTSLGSRLFSMLGICSLTLKQKMIKKSPIFSYLSVFLPYVFHLSSSQAMVYMVRIEKNPQEISQYLLNHHTKPEHRMQSASLSHRQILRFCLLSVSKQLRDTSQGTFSSRPSEQLFAPISTRVSVLLRKTIFVEERLVSSVLKQARNSH